jgi:hypothetical protein
MVEANQAYHPQIVRTIIAIALYEARKEIKRNIQREGRVKLCKVPHREIERMAKAMVMERRDEFLARAKASSVVRDELRRLQAKEERKRQRRASKILPSSPTKSAVKSTADQSPFKASNNK